jgi:hypothetical protein
MATLLTSLNIALSALLFGGGISLAVWSWRKLGITVFAWIILVRLTQTLVFLPWAFGASPAQRSQMEAAVKALKANPALDPTELFLLWCSAESFFPLLSTVALFLLAAVETAHVATRLHPEWQMPAVMRRAHRLRHGFGPLAILAVMAPTFAMRLWLSLGTS